MQNGLDATRAKGGGTWWPALEGLRGFGVVVLLIGHHDPKAITGAFLTVSMFFTLSGFLITTLLLRERERTGRIDVVAFWKRRARRLLPTAMFGLLLAALVAYATRSAAVMGSVASDIRWAALNLANWRFISTNSAYAEVMAVPSTVGHYWSLAIEEQYYLLYPLLALVALRFRRVGLGVALGSLTVASLVAQFLTDGGDRAYYGTDTRLAELAMGGLAAVLWSGELRERLQPHIDIIGAIAGAGAFSMWMTLPLGSTFAFRGGVAIHAVLAAVFMIGLSHGTWLGRPLHLRPLQWLGGVSYAAYVVHLPLYLYLDAERVGFGGLGLLAVRMGATIGLAGLVVALIERPVRDGSALVSFRGQAPIAMATILGVVLLIATALPEVGRKASELELFTAGRQFEPELIVAPVPDVVDLPSTTTVVDATTSTVATSTTAARAGTSPTGGTGGTATTAPAEQPRALKLLTAGDSTAGVWGAGMQEWGAAKGYASADRSGGPGCVLFQPGKAHLRPGWVYTPSAGCSALPDLVISNAKESHPDVLVLIIGSLQLSDWVEQEGGPAFALGDPSYDARYRDAFSRALSRFSSELKIPILVATIPVPSWKPTNAPGEGPITANDAARTRRLNEINRSVVSGRAGVRMVDFASLVSDSSGRIDPALHPDGLHIDPDAVPGVMDRGLADRMRTAYRAIVGTNPRAPPTWKDDLVAMNDEPGPPRPTWLFPAAVAVAVAAVPVVTLLDAGRTGLDGGALVVMRINASLVLGGALYALVRWFLAEARMAPLWRARIATAVLAVALLGGAAAAPLLEPKADQADEATKVDTDAGPTTTWVPPTFPNLDPAPTGSGDSTTTTLDPGTAALTPPELRTSTTTSRPGAAGSTTTSTARGSTATTTTRPSTGPTSPSPTTTRPSPTTTRPPTSPSTTRPSSPTTSPTIIVGPTTTTAPAPTTTTTRAPTEQARPLRVLSVGDSTAGVWGVGMDKWGNDPAHRMDVDLAGGPGCALYAPGFAALRPGWDHQQPTNCASMIDVAISEGRRLQSDVVVLMVGSMQLSDWKTSAQAAPTSIGQAGYDSGYRAAITSAIRRLTSELGVPVLMATVPIPRWNPTDAPGSGPLTTNNATRTRRLNEINRSVVAGFPRARMAPFAEAVDTADGSVDLRLHPDGLHIESSFVPGVLDAGLEGQLRSLYRSVITAEPGIRRSGTTIWWP